MFLLRDIPDEKCLDQLAVRYPDLDLSSVVAIMAFLGTSAALVDAYDKFLSQHGLSQGRFAVLNYLNRKPELAVNQTQLAEAYGVTKATITGLIDGLERDGLVERLADLQDRRASLVRLTQAGREFLNAILPFHFRRTARVFADFDAADRQALIQMMTRIREGMRRTAAEEQEAGEPNVSCRRPPVPPAA